MFRRTLWLWLAAAAAALLAALVLVLRWGMEPIRQLVGELRGVEAGTQGQIESAYPGEIMPLTGALNAPDIKEFLFKQGLDAAPGTPEELAKYMKSEYVKWAKVIKAAGLKGLDG